MKTKITEPIRTARLRRPLVKSVTWDGDGFALHVTSKRAFWAMTYRPKGINPSTGRRWGGGVRHELGDAMLMTPEEARTAALTARLAIKLGRDPHRDRLASTANVVAQRSIVPTTSGEALAAYAAALAARRQPSATTRKKYVHYARKAVRLMKTETLPLTSIDIGAVRILIETMNGSDAERHDVFGGLNRFLGWAHKLGLIEANPCSRFDRHERPKPGKARDHVPTVETLRTIWHAVENEPRRDLVRFMLLEPLRRAEAAGLIGGEVDLQQGRIKIAAVRTKNGEAHELPLSAPALALIKANMAPSGLVFPTSKGKPYAAWDDFLIRLRKRIGQNTNAKAERFVLHDIRRAFVSHLAERGFDVDLLDQCLGHSRRGVFGVYQRASRMAERARALETWAGLVTGAGEARVIAFRR
jgi:integrase